MTSIKILSLINNLFRSVDKKFKLHFILLFSLVVLSSAIEMISIGAIVPFLSMLVTPDGISNFTFLREFFTLFAAFSSEDFTTVLTLFFGTAIIVSGFLRLAVVWLSTNLSYRIGADLSLNIYRRTLYQPYITHINRNSTFVMDAMFTKVNLVSETIILGSLNFIASLIMIISILCILITVNFYLTSITFIFFGFFYSIIIIVIRSKSLSNSKKIAEGSSNVLKLIQEGLGGIRDVLIGSHQEAYCEIYNKANYKIRKTQGINFVLSVCPKFIMESLGIVFLAALAFLFNDSRNGLLQALPMIGLIALGSQRLLPSLQQLYTSWMGILTSHQSLIDVLNLLNQPVRHIKQDKINTPLNFKKNISLKKVSFSYNEKNKCILDNINLTIYKGDRIGIVGKSGSGKSTLVDLIMGLLTPSKGSIHIDNRSYTSIVGSSWQKNISHVPQSVFLSDSSIASNIAFGCKLGDIDFVRVKKAAKLACLSEWIDTLPSGYESSVGERGVNLSGGLRQRIGIARALYNKRNIIVLDEATSALDNQTQDEIIRNIGKIDKDITLIVIAHRPSALRCCSKIFKVENCKIQKLKG